MVQAGTASPGTYPGTEEDAESSIRISGDENIGCGWRY